MKIHAILTAGILIWLTFLSGCGEKMPLPSVQRSDSEFGANDTSYVHINPVWSAGTIGYSAPEVFSPVDIAIGDDGFLFVADSANNKVITLAQSGVLQHHQGLDEIGPVEGPVGLGINSKLNLLIVNHSNTIFCWNQYINNIGADAIAFGTDENGDLFWQTDAALLDSVFQVHPVYQDGDASARFRDVAFGPGNDNFVYVTDYGTNRILQLELHINGVVRLTNGYMHPLYGLQYKETIASFGSGAGTVDNPAGIVCDDLGNIYFTQFGGNFLIQKLEPSGDSFVPGFTLYEHPIMDLGRFSGPRNIALGLNDAIFTLDTAVGQVFKFYNKGSKAGQEANLGKQGLVNFVFNNALGIAISDEGIIYIAETGNHQIRRFQPSVSDNDLPIEQP